MTEPGDLYVILFNLAWGEGVGEDLPTALQPGIEVRVWEDLGQGRFGKARVKGASACPPFSSAQQLVGGGVAKETPIAMATESLGPSLAPS